MKTISVLFLVVVLVLSFACTDEEKCGNFPTSSLAFNYSGFLNGAYSVSGEIPASANIPYHVDWATGKYFTEVGADWMMISTNLITNENIQDVLLYIPNTGVGQFVSPGPASYCGNIVCGGLFFDYYDVSLQTLFYQFLSVEVDVTYSDCNRIKGSFNARLYDVNDSSKTMEMTDGKFDVHTKCMSC